jgi:hypothetical protein
MRIGGNLYSEQGGGVSGILILMAVTFHIKNGRV